jgi:sulfur carrier protein ThiS
MKIKIELFASLMDNLPEGADNRQAEIEVNEAVTPLQVMESLKIPLKLVHIVLIDGVTLSQEEIRTRILIEGQTMTVFPPVAGG